MKSSFYIRKMLPHNYHFRGNLANVRQKRIGVDNDGDTDDIVQRWKDTIMS